MAQTGLTVNHYKTNIKRNTPTKSESEQIRNLLRELIGASRIKQKSIHRRLKRQD